MKRTAGAFMLLASLGGGCTGTGPKDQAGHFNRAQSARDVRGLMGPRGEPVPRGHDGQAAVAHATGVGVSRGVAPGQGVPPSGVMQTAGWLRHGGDCETCSHFGGHPGIMAKHGWTPGGPNVPYPGPHGGIYPVPTMGPAGAVAAVGALPAHLTPVPTNSRTSIRFAEPAGMRISWFGANGVTETPLEAPARYNFLQGGIYRLKISSIPNRPGLDLYPTMEVLPATPKSATYLAHSSVPVVFTDEDFEQVASGNFLVKVIYLPDKEFQDITTIAGPNEVVSSRLEPGVDPVVEAQRRGTILMIIRMGNIDLQAPNTPAMDAPNPYMMGRPGPGAAGPGGSGGMGGSFILPPPKEGGGMMVVPKTTPMPLPKGVTPAPMPTLIDPPKVKELDPKTPAPLPKLQ